MGVFLGAGLGVAALAAVPVITSQPTSKAVTAGEAATFAASVSGTPAPTYQWQKLLGSTWTTIDGATATSYATAATAPQNNGTQFRVVAKNTSGTTTSSSALLTVYYVSITQQPVSKSVPAGTMATFSVTAAGNPSLLTYKWLKKAPGQSGYTVITGATGSSYTTPASTSADNGAAYCALVGNGKVSRYSSGAVLTVAASPAPKITTQPVNQSVNEGQTATFKVAASGSPTPTYQWQRLVNSAWATISGATSASYTTAATGSGDQGAQFRVLATNTNGVVTSSVAVLTVNYIAIKQQPATQSVAVGTTATFTVAATGNPSALTYKWLRRAQGEASYSVIPGATNATYTTPSTATGDNGASYCALVGNGVVSRYSSGANLMLMASQPSGSFSGYYGPRINADDIANAIIGRDAHNGDCNKSLAIRFRATHSGILQKIRPFFIWSSARPGYALGNGGNIQIQVQTDDGSLDHLPSGTVKATLQYDAPVTKGNFYPVLTYATPATLVAGQIYHLVFKNVAADPSANWVSLDNLFVAQGYTQEQPTIPNSDLALLESTDATCHPGWVPYDRGGGSSYTPVIEMIYSDGFAQGQGYIQGYDQTESWNPKRISGTESVREVFTVSGNDRSAGAVAVRVNRASGSGSLTIRLEQSNGTLVATGTVLVPMVAKESWAKCTFAAPITLKAGTTYNLVLISPTGTTHTTHALQEGSSYGFSANTYFKDGYAQYNDGSGWKTWNLWGIANTTQADLQFYFGIY